MSVITLAEAKAFVGISHTDDDTFLTDLIAQTEAEVARLANVVFEQTDYDEYVDGTGERYIILRRPLVSVSSIEVDDIAYDLTNAKIATSTGILYMPVTIPEGFRNVHAVYTAGYTTLPDDLKLACLLRILARYLLARTEIQSTEGETPAERARALIAQSDEIIRGYAL